MSELQRMQDRVAELENVLGLTAQFPKHLFPKGTFALKVCEPLLGLAMARPFVTYPAAYDALFGDRAEADQPEPKHVQVAICYLRKGLKHYGIKIVTDWGQGFHITDADKAKLRGIIDGAKASAA